MHLDPTHVLWLIIFAATVVGSTVSGSRIVLAVHHWREDTA
jgi:hypothetical protein